MSIETSLPARVRLEGPVVGTYAALAALMPTAGGRAPIGEDALAAELSELCAFVDMRRDCADFRAIALLAVVLGSKVPEASEEQVKRSLVGFKYWMAEPGDDAMCFWSENHQLLFATAEYLAGATYSEETFSNDRRAGAEHRVEGHFAASSGRLYESQKKHPASSEMQPIVDLAFTDDEICADWNRIGMVFCLRRQYEVPSVIREIAHDPAPRTARSV